jgi:hypothetical protein
MDELIRIVVVDPWEFQTENGDTSLLLARHIGSNEKGDWLVRFTTQPTYRGRRWAYGVASPRKNGNVFDSALVGAQACAVLFVDEAQAVSVEWFAAFDVRTSSEAPWVIADLEIAR